MATEYSGWSGESTQGSRKYRCKLTYSVSYPDNDTAKISADVIFNVNGQITNDTLAGRLYYPSGSTLNSSVASKKISADTNKTLISKTFTVERTESAQSKGLAGSVKAEASGWSGAWKKTDTVTVSIKQKAYDIEFVFPPHMGIIDSSGYTSIDKIKLHNAALDITDVNEAAPRGPARNHGDFLGWSLTEGKSSLGPDDISGNTISAEVNEDTTYYPVIHRSYTPPTISNIRAYRVADTASGQDPDVKSNGQKCYIDFDFTMPDQISGDVTYSIAFGSSTPITGTISQSGRVFAYTGAGHLPTSDDETVTVTINVTDYRGNTYTYTDSTYISSEVYLLDMYKGTVEINGSDVLYQSLAIGKEEARDADNTTDSSSALYGETLSENGNFDVYMDTEFENDVRINGGLYFNDSDTPIGTVIQKLGGTDYTTDLATGSTGTDKNIASIVLPKGIWIVQIRCRYTPSSSGAHYSRIAFSTTSQYTAVHDRKYMTGDSAIAHNVTNIIVQTNDEPQTYYLAGSVGGQTGHWNRTSSAALLIRAVRIL